MSIQSRFNDYYDWLFYSYRDPNFYWKRKNVKDKRVTKMNKYRLEDCDYFEDEEYSEIDYIIYSFSASELGCDYSISIVSYEFNQLVIYISESIDPSRIDYDRMYKVYYSQEGIKPFVQSDKKKDSFKEMKDFLEYYEEYLVNIYYASINNQNEYVRCLEAFKNCL